MTTTVIPDYVREAAARVPARAPRGIVEVALLRHEQGWPRRRIAEEAYINVGTFDRWRKFAGLGGRGSGTPGTERAPRSYINAVIESYRRTERMAETATELGRHETVIRAVLLRHAPDLIRPVGGPRIPTPDGWETVEDYARRHDRPVSSLYAALRAGKVPGARRFPQPRSATKSRWLIPAGAPDAPMRRLPRRERPVDQLGARRAARRRQQESDTQLPARPFSKWILHQDLTPDELAHNAGVSDGSRLRMISKGEQAHIGMSTADQYLTANDGHLHDVWPHLDDQLALVAWAREVGRPLELQPDAQPAADLAVAA